MKQRVRQGTRQYSTRFQVPAKEGFVVPTPEGTGWDQVSIAEAPEGRLTVTVETADADTFVSTIRDEDGRIHWEESQQPGQIVRRFDLMSFDDQNR